MVLVSGLVATANALLTGIVALTLTAAAAASVVFLAGASALAVAGIPTATSSTSVRHAPTNARRFMAFPSLVRSARLRRLANASVWFAAGGKTSVSAVSALGTAGDRP